MRKAVVVVKRTKVRKLPPPPLVRDPRIQPFAMHMLAGLLANPEEAPGGEGAAVARLNLATEAVRYAQALIIVLDDPYTYADADE